MLFNNKNSQINKPLNMAETEETFSVLDSIPDLSEFKSFTDRYFSKRYVVNVNDIENNDIMIMFHSNRIAVLCLAPSHHFFKKDVDYKVNFNVGGIDRLTNAVKGKGKKGGIQLFPKSPICRIEYTDGTSFDVPSCMKGALVEVNDRLTENPGLLKQMPDCDGYIAVILASIANSEATKNELLTHEQYLQEVKCTDLTIKGDR